MVTHHAALHTVFLAEADSLDREEVCAALPRRAGRVDEVDRCAAVLMAWVLVPWDGALLLQATTTTIKVLMVKVLHHVSSRRTVRATGAHLLSLLWE